MLDRQLVVIKPFNTVSRRFQLAQVISPDDLVDDAMAFEDRRRRFLTGHDTRAADQAALKVKEEGPLFPESPEPPPAPANEPEEPQKTVKPPEEPVLKRPGRHAS